MYQGTGQRGLSTNDISKKSWFAAIVCSSHVIWVSELDHFSGAGCPLPPALLLSSTPHLTPKYWRHLWMSRARSGVWSSLSKCYYFAFSENNNTIEEEEIKSLGMFKLFCFMSDACLSYQINLLFYLVISLENAVWEWQAVMFRGFAGHFNF